MDLKEFLVWASVQDEKLIKKYSLQDKTKRALAYTVKISEEVGELANEILHAFSLQRQEKHSKQKLGEEFSDVLITTLITAQSLGIDIERALKNKMSKINKRY